MKPILSSFVVFLLAVLSLISCKSGWTGELFSDSKAYGVYQDSIDTLRMAGYLRGIIEKDDSKQKCDQMVRQRYDSLVGDFAQCPLWFSEDGVSEDARVVSEHIAAECESNGLNPDAFCLSQIEDDLAVVDRLAFDSLGLDINEVLVRLDYNLSKAYMRYVVGQRYGFVRPDKLFNKLYIRSDRGYYARLFDYDLELPDYASVMKHLEGDDRAEYLQQSVPANAELYNVLKDQMKTATDTAEYRKYAVNIERCRWRIKHPKKGERCVIVNLPAQQLWAMGGKSPLSMKICCGAWDTKTPLLASEVGYMQVNPEWSLPPKIVESDFARHVGDSAWFARHKYFVVNRKTGDTLNIASIGSSGLRNQGLRFVQRGGQGNSLGRIVFRFASNFSIYLHDTNMPGVFARDRRTVSHGCIRVERPFDLACYFIPEADEWTLEKMRISMDIPPVTDRGRQWLRNNSHKPRPYRLLSYHGIKPKVPIYIMYYTRFPNPQTGVVETWPDFYGYDTPVAKAMGDYLGTRN